MQLQPEPEPQLQYQPQSQRKDDPPTNDLRRKQIAEALADAEQNLDWARNEILMSQDELPDGSVTIILNKLRVDVFDDGTVLHMVLSDEELRKYPDRPRVPNAHYIIAGPAGKRCHCCYGSGRE